MLDFVEADFFAYGIGFLAAQALFLGVEPRQDARQIVAGFLKQLAGQLVWHRPGTALGRKRFQDHAAAKQVAGAP